MRKEDPVKKALIADLKAWSFGLIVILTYWTIQGGSV